MSEKATESVRISDANGSMGGELELRAQAARAAAALPMRSRKLSQ
jgi:hypothetical protein